MLHISLSQSMYGVFSFYLHLYLPENVAVIKRWVNGNQQQAPTLMSRSAIVARLTVNTLIHCDQCCQTGNREYTYVQTNQAILIYTIVFLRLYPRNTLGSSYFLSFFLFLQQSCFAMALFKNLISFLRLPLISFSGQRNMLLECALRQ